MPGDVIDLGVKAWYPHKESRGGSNTPMDPTPTLLELFSGSAATTSGGHFSPAAAAATTSPLLAGIQEFLSSHPETPSDPTKPKAYINWVMFDENLNYVPDGSGFINVDGFSENIQTLAQQGITINKSGYLFVYLSNETQHYDVFFDNMVVDQTPGAVLEETHYYPFGLTQTGISSYALGITQNKKKYNGIEFDKDLDLNIGEAVLRDVDVQTGRWWQVDPKIDEMYTWSPYASNYDNPIRYQDRLGDEPNCCGGFFSGVAQGFVDGLKSTGQFVKSLGTLQGWKNVATGLSDMNPAYSSPEKTMRMAATGENIISGIANIPNMSAKDWGHAIGFGGEKIIETAVVSKGAGVISNGSVT